MARRTFFGGVGGSLVGRRFEAGFGTDPLAAEAQTSEGLTSIMSTGYALYRLSVSSPARVRFYATAAARDADADREFATPPEPADGCVLDVELEGGWVNLLPVVHGANLEDPPAPTLPFTVTNLDVEERAISVGIMYVVTEAD